MLKYNLLNKDLTQLYIWEAVLTYIFIYYTLPSISFTKLISVLKSNIIIFKKIYNCIRIFFIFSN